MRTTAEARRSAAAERADAGADKPQGASELETPAVAVTAGRLLRLDEGLYTMRIGPLAGARSEVAGMAVPVAHVSAPFAEDGNGIEIVAAFPRRGAWIDQGGGTVVLRSPLGGGYVIVAAYGAAGQPAGELSLDLRRLDGPQGAEAAVAPAADAPIAGQPANRDVATEILLHIERAGDRLFPGRGWVGALGRRMRIEAFSIRPLERLSAAEIEMKGFLPNGGETPWIPGGTLCGTRGRGLPLVGFAVRVVPQRANRFAANYQGSFFGSGISATCQNGEPCRAPGGDDVLEAINVRIVERVAEEPAEGEAETEE